MNKTCVGCGKAIPVAARNCFFCGVRQPAVSSTIPSAKPVIAVVGSEGKEKKVTESAPSQTQSTLFNVDVSQLKALREELARRAESPPSQSRTAEPSTASPSKTSNTQAMSSIEAALASVANSTASPSAVPTVAPPVSEPKIELTPVAAPIVVAPANGVALDGGSTSPELAGPPASVAVVPVKVAPAVAAPIVVAEPALVIDDDVDDDAPPAHPAPPLLGEADTDPEVPLPRVRPRAPIAWPLVVRAVMGVGGVLLLVLFGSAAHLLPAFQGSVLALHQFFLVGGVLLLGSAALPLPHRARGVIAASLGALAVFLAAPSVAGFGGWRGVAAAAGFCALPGGLLLRSRLPDSMLARALVGLGVALVAALYLVPLDGVVPIRAAISLITSGAVGGILTSVLFLLPLVLALLASTALVGKDAPGFGPLWAVLLLVVTPGALMVCGAVADDASMVHMGLALLAAGGTVAVGVSEALIPDAPHSAS